MVSWSVYGQLDSNRNGILDDKELEKLVRHYLDLAEEHFFEDVEAVERENFNDYLSSKIGMALVQHSHTSTPMSELNSNFKKDPEIMVLDLIKELDPDGDGK
eukprot:UN24259